MMRYLLLPLALVVSAPALAAPTEVRVRLVTSEGPIVVAVDTKHAPRTAANFLAYADDGRFDDTSFYRSARRKTYPKNGLVQGGIGTDARRTLLPIPHESTAMTGIHHLEGTLSMARGGAPGSAMGNFFICVGAIPGMDARADYPGYAAFGHVVSGMPLVRRILAMPTGGGEGPTRGQMLIRPIKLIRAERIDGVARPTGAVKPWLLKIKRKPDSARPR